MKKNFLFSLFLIISTLGSAQELIVNGDFSNVAMGWQTSGNWHIITNGSCNNNNSSPAYSYFGESGDYVDNGNGQIWQDFIIPTGANTCTLSYKIAINSYETTTTTAFDGCYTFIEYTSGGIINQRSFSNLDGGTAPGCQTYQQYTYQIPSSYFGQQLRVRFYAISDGLKPTMFRVDDVSISYTTISSTGSIKCTINPFAARSAGARWNLDGGEWKVSDFTLTGITPGNHIINFKPVSGWVTPLSQSVNVTSGNLSNVTALYTQNNFTISGNISQNGVGLSNVQLKAEPGNYTAFTNSAGNYNLSIPEGWSVTVTPILANYSFSPATKSYSNLSSNLNSENYLSLTAIPSKVLFENHIDGLIDHPLWSRTTIQSSTNLPLKICADGSQATKITFINHDPYLLTNNIKFWIDSDKFGNDVSQSGYFINYQVSGNKVTAVYSHPSYLASSYTPLKNDLIDIVDFTTGNIIYQIPLEVYRAPILFVHGFVGDRTTFEPLENQLLSTSLYPETGSIPLSVRLHYKEESLSHFFENRYVVQNGIDSVFRKSRKNNFSAGKVIVAGHSMGGILSRLYLQSTYQNCNYRDDIAKLITINTPHYGTQFANNGISDLRLLYVALEILGRNHTLIGAITDMQVNSPATLNQLNIPQYSQNKVPTATLSSNQFLDLSVAAIAIRELFWFKYLSGIMFNGESHDLIVPLSSQKGGITTTPTIINQWHVGSTQKPEIISQFTNLLNANPNSALFAHDGFPNNTLAPPILRNSFGRLGRSNLSDSINIITPINGQNYNADSTVKIHLEYNSNITKLGIIIYGNTISPFTIDTINIIDIDYHIPPNAIGKINILVLGGDSTGWLASDSMHFNVISSLTTDSIKSWPDSVNIPLGLTETMSVEGYFNGSSVGINLIGIPDLNIQYDNTSLLSLGLGKYMALKSGISKIIFNYQQSFDTIVVKIINDPTVLSTLFENSTPNISPGTFVNFYDKSKGFSREFDWNFEGGIPSNSKLKNPVVFYPSEGIFKVKLKTTFINGLDSLSMDSLISVKKDTFTFIGNGNWNIAENWEYNKIPPSIVTKGSVVVINPDSSGECILTGNQTFQDSSTLTIKSGKKIMVVSHLAIDQGLPLVSTVGVDSIKKFSAICTAFIGFNGGSPISERGFCFSTNPSPDINNIKVIVASSNDEYSGILTALTSNQTYYVRPYAINNAGIGYGDQISFKTLSYSNLPYVLTAVRPSNITSSTAVSGASISQGPVNSKGVCWSKTPNPTVLNSKTIDGEGTTDFVSNISGLDSNTTYYLRSYATNGIGTSYGQEITFTTTNSPFFLRQTYAGGTIFYIDSSGKHGIVTSPDLGSVSWSAPLSGNLTESTDTLDGFQNTYQIQNVYGNNTYAAKKCIDYTGGGFSDWYLPSFGEINLIQRSGALFHCWSSTESSVNNAYCSFVGTIGEMYKGTVFPVIAIRKF